MGHPFRRVRWRQPTPPEDAEDLERRVLAALERLRGCPDDQGSLLRRQAVHALNSWSLARWRNGDPVSAARLDELAEELNQVSVTGMPTGSAVIRIDQQLYSSSRLRFH